MDPTDIVLVPFDLDRLTIHVTVITLASFLLHHSYLINKVFDWIQATLVFWIVAVICGTPPTREVYHTILASAYLATLTIVLPIPVVTSVSTSMFSQSLTVSTFQKHGTLFVTVPFMVLRLYDWGSQIQRWPLPILLGSTFGYAIGTIAGSIIILALHCSPPLRVWYDAWVESGKATSSTNSHQD